MGLSRTTSASRGTTRPARSAGSVAELAGDLDGAVAVYTDDVEHDDVGFPGPLVGKPAARGFYEELGRGLQVEDMRLLRRWHVTDACVTEHLVSGRAVGPAWASPAAASGSRSGCCTCSSSATG